eukprot:347805_1
MSHSIKLMHIFCRSRIMTHQSVFPLFRKLSYTNWKPDNVKITFITRDEKQKKKKITCVTNTGQTLSQVCLGLNLIDGDCGEEGFCSTCHVFLSRDLYKKVPAPREAELDLLDTAAEVKDGQSRLGCQLIVDESFDGQTIHLPKRKGTKFVFWRR